MTSPFGRGPRPVSDVSQPVLASAAPLVRRGSLLPNCSPASFERFYRILLMLNVSLWPRTPQNGITSNSSTPATGSASSLQPSASWPPPLHSCSGDRCSQTTHQPLSNASIEFSRCLTSPFGRGHRKKGNCRHQFHARNRFRV